MDRIKCKNYRGEEVKWAHVKRDGFQLRVSKDACGLVTTDLRTTRLDLGFMRQVYLYVPASTVLLGELWYPGRKASAVATAIAEQDPGLRFSCFAIESMPADSSLDEIELLCAKWGLEFPPLDRDWEHVARVVSGQDVLPVDWEGYVFKNGNMLEWYKWKPVKTADLRVVSIKPGLMYGSYQLATRDGTIVASAKVYVPEEDVVGRIAEIAYQYVGSGGRLRHPRFVRWRPDKESADEAVE